MKKKIILICGCILLLSLLSACRRERKKDEDGYFVYYLDNNGSKLEPVAYTPEAGSAKGVVEELAAELNAEVESSDYKSALPKGIRIEQCSLEDGRLNVDFSEGYASMSNIEEVLCRAAVVKTLFQVDEVEYISFTSNQATIDNADDVPMYTSMVADDFIDDTNALHSSVQVEMLTLYFASETGDMLITENVNKKHDGSQVLAELVLELLIAGPKSDNGKPVVPEETKVLSVSVKDNICYVNFDDGFLNQTYDISADIAIYSIVNSLAELPNIYKVQISVNGESDITIRDQISLLQPFEANQDLIKNLKSEDTKLPDEKNAQKNQEGPQEQEKSKKK